MDQKLANEIAQSIWGDNGFAVISRQYNYKTHKFSGKIIGYYVGYTRKGSYGKRVLTTQFRGDSFEDAFIEAWEHYLHKKMYKRITQILLGYGVLVYKE
jgi:hypothetical protein